jgi:ribulose-bisphosphate carboxylase large chain
VVGRIESITPLGGECHLAVISYDPAIIGGEIPQLLNLLFGNISLKSGILITAIDWPEALLNVLPGPRYGIAGLRELCGLEQNRPLTCASLKPLGLSPGELAGRCRALAAGGIDIIKDDHGLANQPSAPFAERVARCQAAVLETNARTGGNTLYVPHLPNTAGGLDDQLALITQHGCKGLLTSPLLIGADQVRVIRQSTELAILSHPALGGAFFHHDHGIAPDVLLGQIFRLIGSDGVVYPNAGGRFVFSPEVCGAINTRLREPLGAIAPAFPIPGGGIEIDRLPYWAEQFGAETIFLIGSSLYRYPDLEEGARAFKRGVSGIPDANGA